MHLAPIGHSQAAVAMNRKGLLPAMDVAGLRLFLLGVYRPLHLFIYVYMCI